MHTHLAVLHSMCVLYSQSVTLNSCPPTQEDVHSHPTACVGANDMIAAYQYNYGAYCLLEVIHQGLTSAIFSVLGPFTVLSTPQRR